MLVADAHLLCQVAAMAEHVQHVNTNGPPAYARALFRRLDTFAHCVAGFNTIDASTGGSYESYDTIEQQCSLVVVMLEHGAAVLEHDAGMFNDTDNALSLSFVGVRLRHIIRVLKHSRLELLASIRDQQIAESFVIIRATDAVLALLVDHLPRDRFQGSTLMVLDCLIDVLRRLRCMYDDAVDQKEVGPRDLEDMFSKLGV